MNPLIVHVGSLAQARAIAEFVGQSGDVAAASWPGALTMVLPRKEDAPIASSVSADLPTLAIRMPDHAIMQALLARCDFPLAAPSANRSNAVSPTTLDHVLETLDGRIDAVLDGGACEKGLESSILAIRHDGSWQELRPGPVDLDVLHRQVIGGPLPSVESVNVEAPGQLPQHYSPGKPVRLNVDAPQADEFMIGFGPLEGDYCLSGAGDLSEAAAQLYAALHMAAHSSRPRIAVASIPNEGVGKAINDRLRRAAA
jgi:L-threonylcarbamoyladenylate synthase